MLQAVSESEAGRVSVSQRLAGWQGVSESEVGRLAESRGGSRNLRRGVLLKECARSAAKI